MSSQSDLCCNPRPTPSQHNAYLQDGKDKEPEVVLIGDSIVQHMTQSKVSVLLNDDSQIV